MLQPCNAVNVRLLAKRLCVELYTSRKQFVACGIPWHEFSDFHILSSLLVSILFSKMVAWHYAQFSDVSAPRVYIDYAKLSVFYSA